MKVNKGIPLLACPTLVTLDQTYLHVTATKTKEINSRSTIGEESEVAHHPLQVALPARKSGQEHRQQARRTGQWHPTRLRDVEVEEQ